jgi:ADP-ribosyl-[dinitrogen reductase] hydrolase
VLINLVERIEGGILGLLVGDALGLPYEFHPSSEIPPLNQIEMEVPRGFTRAYPRVPSGTWSDDGAQALCLLDSLLTQGQMDLHDFSRRLVAWATDGLWAVDGHVFDIGNQTSDAVRELLSGASPSQSGFVRPDGKGNGSLMRVLPLAMWHCGEDEALVNDAHAQSVVTHGHITNQVCCALYCLWARRMLQGIPRDKAYQSAVATLRNIYGDDSEHRKDLEFTICPDEAPSTDGTGFVVSTLNCARIALLQSTYEEVVRTAISFGEDTDTNAAVAGGLAGVAFGVKSIPERWLKKLRGQELVKPLLSRLANYRLQNIARDYSMNPHDVPSADADFERIWQYALTFNGYEYLGEDQCGTFANAVSEQFHHTSELPDTLTLEELRACLFFEQRRYKWTWPHNDDRQLVLVRALMKSIHYRLRSNETITIDSSQDVNNLVAGDPMEIRKLEYEDVRKVWKNEAKDFTMWLAENIDHLGDALGMNISVAETEHKVGSFNVDIFGEDEFGNNLIIENQLERTDHSHLGQILTYAIGVDAKTIIWISPEPRTEHVEVVQWLNETTPADMRWYIVKLEVLRLSDSVVSPLFTKIAGPSIDDKERGEDKKNLAARHVKRLEFWKVLLEELNKRTTTYKNVNPIKDNWLDAGTGLSGVSFSFVVRMDSVAIRLVLNRDKDVNKKMFDFLYEHKENIEKSFGESLVWNRMDAHKSSRVEFVTKSVGLADTSNWGPGVQMLAEKFVNWERVFKPYIGKLSKLDVGGPVD